MPYINVKITKDGVIDEVEPENWGFAGMLTTEYRKKGEEKNESS